jgi:ATP-binding cassette subfamily C protein CydD
MRVLRVSFLSGFALELAASLSVALIAVTIGIRLVNGDLDLLTGLFVLLIAPEAYLPLRNVGAQFHAAAEGVEVSGRVLDFLEEKPDITDGTASFGTGITVLVSPSGAGKSTLLRGARKADTTWMPQRSSLLSGTVRENIAGFDGVDEIALKRSVALASLDDVGLDLSLDSETKLSGGQIQRVALARTFYHALVNHSDLILLDEPTSQQDPKRQQAIADSVKELAAMGYKFAIATHQQPLIALAERQVNLVGKD